MAALATVLAAGCGARRPADVCRPVEASDGLAVCVSGREISLERGGRTVWTTEHDQLREAFMIDGRIRIDVRDKADLWTGYWDSGYLIELDGDRVVSAEEFADMGE